MEFKTLERIGVCYLADSENRMLTWFALLSRYKVLIISKEGSKLEIRDLAKNALRALDRVLAIRRLQTYRTNYISSGTATNIRMRKNAGIGVSVIEEALYSAYLAQVENPEGKVKQQMMRMIKEKISALEGWEKADLYEDNLLRLGTCTREHLNLVMHPWLYMTVSDLIKCDAYYLTDSEGFRLRFYDLGKLGLNLLDKQRNPITPVFLKQKYNIDIFDEVRSSTTEDLAFGLRVFLILNPKTRSLSTLNLKKLFYLYQRSRGFELDIKEYLSLGLPLDPAAAYDSFLLLAKNLEKKYKLDNPPIAPPIAIPSDIERMISKINKHEELARLVRYVDINAKLALAVDMVSSGKKK